MDITRVIKTPIFSPKAYDANSRLKKLVIEVDMQANKQLVKEAFKKLHNAEVANVNILVSKGKKRRDKKGRTHVKPNRKRAIVTFKEGYEIDLANQVGAEMEPVEAPEMKAPGKTVAQKKEK